MPTLVPRALSQRMTLTLAICLTGVAVAVVGLFLPRISPLPDSNNSYAAPAPAEAAPVAADGTPAAADAAPPAAATPAIDIVDFAFAGNFTVAPGATVDVSNVDIAPHTITADDGSFDTGTLDAGAAGTFVAPTDAGTYAFICTIHPFMTGTLTVQS